MKTPRVSVIVPNYNHARYLRERLDSILNQTFSDWELIVLDDASIDDSVLIINAYTSKDSRIVFVPQDANSGSPFAQWNKGVARAQGEYLWIAESDDSAHPELLEVLVGELDAHPGAVLAYAQTVLMDETSRPMHSFAKNLAFVFQTDFFEHSFVADGRGLVHRFMARHNMVPNASGVLMRKNHYLAVGGPPVDWKLNGDWLFYSQLFLRGQVVFNARELNFFRVHQATQRQRANANGRVYEELLMLTEFMETQAGVEPATVALARQEYAEWWAWSLFRQQWKGDFWATNRALYLRWKAYKPFLAGFVVKVAVLSAGKRILAFLGLASTVKQWRNRWFPHTYFQT
jgi:glycosyltransferase involved in cell wall biosynthesis